LDIVEVGGDSESLAPYPGVVVCWVEALEGLGIEQEAGQRGLDVRDKGSIKIIIIYYIYYIYMYMCDTNSLNKLIIVTKFLLFSLILTISTTVFMIYQ